MVEACRQTGDVDVVMRKAGRKAVGVTTNAVHGEMVASNRKTTTTVMANQRMDGSDGMVILFFASQNSGEEKECKVKDFFTLMPFAVFTQSAKWKSVMKKRLCAMNDWCCRVGICPMGSSKKTLLFYEWMCV
jgi:hypothetical protein